MVELVFGNQPETILYKTADSKSKQFNHVLIGTALIIVETVRCSSQLRLPARLTVRAHITG